MPEFPLDPYERPPSETGLCPLAVVYELERLGMSRRQALCLSPAEALAALYYYPARVALIANALRKAPHHDPA